MSSLVLSCQEVRALGKPFDLGLKNCLLTFKKAFFGESQKENKIAKGYEVNKDWKCGNAECQPLTAMILVPKSGDA